MEIRVIIRAKWLRYSVWALCAAPVIVAAERAANPAPSAGAPGQSNIFERPHEKGERNRLGPVTDEEWASAKEFLEAHSPHRFHAIKELATGETREGMKRFMVSRWRGIVQLQSQSPELYRTRVREVELDDEIFGICLQLKHGRGDAKQHQADLNARIAELVNLGLVERRQRIGIIEKSLVDQKKTLENDEHDKARLIQQQYEIVLARGVEGARLGKAKQGSKNTPATERSPGEQ